jgi:hypothetical protein
VFGPIEQARGVRCFLLRRLEKVRQELAIGRTARDLRKLVTA